MKAVAGSFNGTGAAVYICCGFIPDYVKVWAPEDAELAHVEWMREFRAAESNNGFIDHGGAQALALYTAGTGIEPYEGGVVLTATLQTSVTYGEGVYLALDDKDYRFADAKAPGGIGDAVAVNIDTWTLDTSGNRTGHFNEDVTGTYIGEGSRIMIDGKWYIIEAVSAAAGEGTDEVTLSRAAASGKVEFITGMYSYAPVAVGVTTKAGFKLNATSDINVNDEIQAFVAMSYDD